MSFIERENASVHEPVELFTFSRGAEAHYFTSHDVDIVRAGITYRATLAEREGFAQSQERSQANMIVRISARAPLGDALMANGLDSQTSGPIYMSHGLTHADDPTGEVWWPFVGEVTELARLTTHVEVSVEPVQSLLRRSLLRVVGGTQCNHTLYDTGCGVRMSDWETAVTIAAADGTRSVTIFPDPTTSAVAMFTGGDLSAGVLKVGNRKWFIERNVGGVLDLLSPFPANLTGAAGLTYPGCDRSYKMCKERFGNMINFGGFPRWPVRNPFDDAS